MMHRVGGEGLCTKIVTPKKRWYHPKLNIVFCKKLLNPNKFYGSRSESPIFRLSARECNNKLFTRTPCDEVAP